MLNKVTLTIVEGEYKGKEFSFEERTICIIGRRDDCNIVIPNEKEYSTISRYHCLLDINPPNIRIRDFGSRNGTYVNGKLIGKREAYQTPKEQGYFILYHREQKPGFWALTYGKTG